jgi:RNA polymerase sigma-32 factor
MLEAAEERKLAVAAQAGSRAATEALVTSHVRLVVSIAREFAGYGVPIDDLVSEGMLGLVEATQRFDPERGVRLAAYAAWWIRAYMRRYSIMNRRIVRAPSTRHGRRLLANLRKVQRELTQTNGTPPDAGEIASAMQVSRAEVEETEAALSGRDLPVAVDPQTRAMELAAHGPSPEEQAAEHEELDQHRQALERALADLTPREREILRRRYFGAETTSLSTIGAGLGLSRERVRQLEREATTKLREAILPSVA